MFAFSSCNPNKWHCVQIRFPRVFGRSSRPFAAPALIHSVCAGIPAYSICFGPESIILENEDRNKEKDEPSGAAANKVELTSPTPPTFLATDLRYFMCDPKNKGHPTPFWSVERTSVCDDANMSLIFVETTTRTGCRLDVPPGVAC